MGRAKRLAAGLYLVAGAVVVATFSAAAFGPFGPRLTSMLGHPAFRAFLGACLAICALQLLYTLGRIVFDRPEPACVHPQGAPDVEVTLAALESVARSAARVDGLIVEEVRCGIKGRDASSILVEVQAIALEESALDGLASRVSDRVRSALDSLLGPSSARVRVRFLPSKTTTVTREVHND